MQRILEIYLKFNASSKHDIHSELLIYWLNANDMEKKYIFEIWIFSIFHTVRMQNIKYIEIAIHLERYFSFFFLEFIDDWFVSFWWKWFPHLKYCTLKKCFPLYPRNLWICVLYMVKCARSPAILYNKFF